jgi:hypothetical protein
MNNTGLIKLKSIVHDLILKEIKSESKDRGIIFYIGLIESNFSQESLLYKIILDDAKKLIKDIENESIKLNDTVAIIALLAMYLLRSNHQRVREKINTYLKSRLLAFEYSPLKNAMMLFLLCQCIDFLESSIKGIISEELTNLMATSQAFENACLIYASSLNLNKNYKESVKENFAKKIIQYKTQEMTLSQGIYALWFYEIFIAPYINSFEQVLKLQIEKWSRDLKKEIMPKLLKELSSKPIETSIDEELISEQLSISTFELSLIYETILKNKDKFLIISQQDFTNELIEKSKNIFLEKIKWQSYFWILLSISFFTIPWYLLGIFNLRILLTGTTGILSAISISFLRYKHIKRFLIEKREWLSDNHKNLLSGLSLGILGAYMACFADLKGFFQLKLAETYNILLMVIVSIAGILAYIISPLKNILKDLFFSIKLTDELKESENK